MTTETAVLTTDYAALSTADRVVSIARTWLGTPYHHQASVKGHGCDCLGLVRGVYRELYLRDAEAPPTYTRDLAEATGTETLIEAARRHLVEVEPFGNYTAGDVLIFRLRPGAMAKHCGIVTVAGEGRGGRGGWEKHRVGARMIHAFEGADVCEVNLAPWWQRRVAAVFRFPDE